MNSKVLIADEAIADIFGLVQYIHTDLCNPDAAEKLYHNLNREVKHIGDFPLKFSDSGIKYRGYIIHKKVYESYLIFSNFPQGISRGCKKSCVYGEVIFLDMNQICRNLLSNIVIFMLSNFFSDNSITNPLNLIHAF